jgi:hypothetical protein
MLSLGRWTIRRLTIRGGALAVAGALAVGAMGYAAPASAARTAPANQPEQPGAVSPTPVAGTPALVQNTGKTKDNIRQIVQCGDTMYAVGVFSQVVQGDVTYPRSNVFSFSATPPYTITPWAPQVNGEVNSIAFDGTTCANAYIGGAFTAVGSAPARYIAEIDTTAGALVPGFGTASTGGQVETLLGVGGHILVGGHFTSINKSTDRYMVSISPVTGLDDGFLQLGISGFNHYCNTSSPPQCTTGNASSVYNQQLSHGGTLDLVEGDFTSVGGVARQQIFMLNLATNPATVTAWTSPEWDGSQGNLPGGYPYQCMPVEAFYIRAAAWSPDDNTVYIATTGYHPWNQPTGTSPRTGLCDAVAAFPATQAPVTHTWVEYSGCDSYYSVAADNAAVYAAGHERFADNNNGCNFLGSGGITDHGLQGLYPATGTLELRPSGSPVYSMSRANADNMLITSTGLWIASTNRFTINKCGDLKGPPGHNSADHAGICFLPNA